MPQGSKGKVVQLALEVLAFHLGRELRPCEATQCVDLDSSVTVRSAYHGR